MRCPSREPPGAKDWMTSTAALAKTYVEKVPLYCTSMVSVPGDVEEMKSYPPSTSCDT